MKLDERLAVSAMTAEFDIWRAAIIIVKQHGEDAAIIAAQRADVLLVEVDIEGQLVFKAIMRAINDPQRVDVKSPL